MLKQRTIEKTVQATGIGLHSGKKVRLTFRPAPTNTGIIIYRVDLDPAIAFPVHSLDIGETRLASVLVKNGARVSTVEHLLSACAGLGIDNLFIDVTGEEIPIMDGSAASFVFLLQQAGLKEQTQAKKFIKVKQKITVHDEKDPQKWASLSPYHGFLLQFYVQFNHPAIKASGQFAEIDFSTSSYIQEIARARTFGFAHEVESLRSQGLAQGGSLENVIVLDEYRVLNPEGLRYADEFVRHKILDAIGDLYTIGHPLLAHYTAHKSGHALNNQLLRALLAAPESYEILSFAQEETAPLGYQTSLAWV